MFAKCHSVKVGNFLVHRLERQAYVVPRGTQAEGERNQTDLKCQVVLRLYAPTSRSEGGGWGYIGITVCVSPSLRVSGFCPDDIS